MSYQPEERYWTDYLRIALPVVGLLLMLGLFWFWAASLIRGDTSGKAPTPKPQAAVSTVVTSPTATPANTPVVHITPTPPSAPVAVSTASAKNPPAVASTAPASSGSTATASKGGGPFNSGDVVTVTDDGVNLRDAPSTSGNIVATLAKGDQLTVTGAPQQADGYTWYPVEDVNQEKGYVASTLLSAGQ